MELNVEINGLKELQTKFSGKRLLSGISVCLNRATKSGKTEISKQLRDRWNIQKSVIDKKMHVSGSTSNTLSTTITIIGEPISLIYFNPIEVKGGIKTFAKRNKGSLTGLAQKKVRSKNSGGISVEILRGKKTLLAKTFFIMGKGGTPLVVRRTGLGKGKLQARKVITQASMSMQDKVIAPVKERILGQFNKEWDNQVRQLDEGRGDWLEKD